MISATIAGSLFALALDRLLRRRRHRHQDRRRVAGAAAAAVAARPVARHAQQGRADGARQHDPGADARDQRRALARNPLGPAHRQQPGVHRPGDFEHRRRVLLVVSSAGSFNRSGANYEAGAKTPLANVYSSLFLVAIVLVVAPLAAYLPLASVAAILFLIAYGLIDVRRMKSIFGTSRTESAVMFVTLVAALFLGLQTAIYAGVLLSLMLFLNQAAHPGIRDVKPDLRGGTFHFDADTGLPDCPQLKMLRVNGSIFFGAVEHVEDAFHRVDRENPQQKHLLIAASGINIVDISGAEMLAREAQRRRKMGGGLYFYFMKDAVHDVLHEGRYLKDIGEENIFPRADAIGAIYPRLDPGYAGDARRGSFRNATSRCPNGEPRRD